MYSILGRDSFCFNYCFNSAWHGGDQFVALLRWYGSPGLFDSGLQLICIFGLLFLIIIYNKYVYIYVFNGIDSVDKTRPVLFDAVMILLDSVKIQSVVKLNIWLNKTLTLLLVWMIQSVPYISEHCFRRVWITWHETFITLIILLCSFVVVCVIFILLWSSKSYLFSSTKDKI